MVGCVAVWLVVLAAIAQLVPGTAQFQTCYDNAAANCGGNVVTVVSTARDCCLGNGFWFQLSGQCRQCIVHGFERTVVSVDEGNVQETLVISLDIKGTTTDELPQNRVTQVDLTVMCDDVSTESDDYSTTGCGSRVQLDVNNPAALTSRVLITFPADSDALEGTEFLLLTLDNTQTDVANARNIFFQNTSIQIRDTTVLRCGFSDDDYSGNEGPDRQSTVPSIPCAMIIILQGTTIEAPLTFRLIPQTIPEYFAANGPLPTANLRGANASRMDFNDTQPFEITMAAGTEAVLAEIPIVDDEINEAAEEFVVVLEVVDSTTNPVKFTTQTTVCRILRSDPIEIGFRQQRVEHDETTDSFVAVLEKDRQSEQTFVVRIQNSTLRIQGVGEPATTYPSTPADFRVNDGPVITRLPPEVNRIEFQYEIFEDNTPENTEIFQLSADPDPDTPNNPDFDCDADARFRFNGRDCFPDLQVLILDDDVVVVGFVKTLVEVDESDGQATLIVNISIPEPNPLLPFVIMFRLDATMTSITAGPRPASFGRFDPVTPGIQDYQEVAPASVLPHDFERTRRLQTFNVQIFEDDVPEDVEELNITLSLQDPRLANQVAVTPAVATVRIRDSDTAAGIQVAQHLRQECFQAVSMKSGEPMYPENCLVRLALTNNDAVVVGFDPTTYTVTESEGAVVMFRIVSTQPVFVRFSTSPGTATAADDFLGQTGVNMTFAPSDTDWIVSVTVVNDDILENTEEFTAVLTIPGSMVVMGSATATITDDDSVVIQFEPVMYTMTEGSSKMLRIVRVGSANIPVSATISTVVGTAEVADFTAIPNQVVTFQPGDTEQFVPFNSSADDVVEGTEMLTAVLSNPSAGATLGQDTATISIMNVEVVVVEFDPSMYTVTESEGAVVMFRIMTCSNTTRPVSVLFSTSPGTATDPADFTGQTNVTVTFAPGETEQNVSVSVVSNDTVENAETFTATLTAAPGSMAMIGAADTATATITDDDIVVTSPDNTTVPPGSNSVGPIAGAVVAVSIISFSIIIIVIIVTRRHRARFDLRKEESQGAAAVSGGASEVKFKEDIPMAVCAAYGTLGTHQTSGEYSFIQSFPGGVSEGQQRMDCEKEAAEGVYEPIPN